MPANDDRPFGYDTLTLDAVVARDDQVSAANIAQTLRYDAVKVPAVLVQEGGTAPGYPYIYMGKMACSRIEGAAQAPASRAPDWPSDEPQGENPVPRLPRTRFRFGAALLGGQGANPPALE